MEKAWRPEWPPDRRFLQTWSLSTGKNETGIPGTLNRFFRPGCRSTPSVSYPYQSPGHPGRAIENYFCRCLKNEKTAFLSSNKKAVFCCFCSFGGWTSTVGRFWKIGPEKPGNPHEYWKKQGWHLFRHPCLGGSDEIVVRWFNAIWKDFISPKIKTSTQQNENHRFRIDTFDCFYNPFFLFFLFDVPFL